MIDEKTLRDEFEEKYPPSNFLDGPLEKGSASRLYESMFSVWKAAHAKYAPRWMPIDEAAKDGRLVIARFRSYRPHLANWISSEMAFVDENGMMREPTHYMNIPQSLKSCA